MAIRNRRTRSPCICSCSYPGSPWSILSFHTLFCLFQVLFSTAARKKQKQKRKTKTKNKQKEKRNEKTHVNNRQKSISHVAYPPPPVSVSVRLCFLVLFDGNQRHSRHHDAFIRFGTDSFQFQVSGTNLLGSGSLECPT